MIGDELPDDRHVVRYVGFSNMFDLDEGIVDGGAFLLTARELDKDQSGLSVHCLECFGVATKELQLEEVRKVSRLRPGANSRFAELEVGRTKKIVIAKVTGIRFVHDPLDADGRHASDPSHSEIRGLDILDPHTADMVADMIAKRCVTWIHPGRERN